jgi:SAM-dependent methyltransferase
LTAAAFAHRSSYDTLPNGRDRYIVRAIGPWLKARLGEQFNGAASARGVLDVGCGEQPFRATIEGAGIAYDSMDVVQNSQGNVGVLAGIDAPLPEPWPGRRPCYDVILCSEVLEHVRDWPQAFANLRRLLIAGGRLIVTVPFVFPLHMEPYDYYRVTPYALTQLAERHGFRVLRLDKLGGALDVLGTISADVSVLPAQPRFLARAKAYVARRLRNLTLAVLDSRWFQRGLQFNSNTYLSNGLILEAV